MLSLLELLMTQQTKNRKIFKKILKGKTKFQIPKINCFVDLHFFSSHDSKNANHMKILLTGTDHHNSKFSKVIQFEEKQSLNILIFEKICKRTITKIIFMVKNIEYIFLILQCFFVTLITVSFICSIIFQYLPPLVFNFIVLFHLLFLNLLARPETRSTIQLHCLIRFDCNPHSISLQYTIEKIFTKRQQRFKTRKETMRKNC